MMGFKIPPHYFGNSCTTVLLKEIMIGQSDAPAAIDLNTVLPETARNNMMLNAHQHIWVSCSPWSWSPGMRHPIGYDQLLVILELTKLLVSFLFPVSKPVQGQWQWGMNKSESWIDSLRLSMTVHGATRDSFVSAVWTFNDKLLSKDSHVTITKCDVFHFQVLWSVIVPTRRGSPDYQSPPCCSMVYKGHLFHDTSCCQGIMWCYRMS